jgi:hypothetical protein
MDMWTSRQSDLPTCPHGATTISDCRCWFPHETTKGRCGAACPPDDDDTIGLADLNLNLDLGDGDEVTGSR